jgi:voltage-gated potassium channel
MRKKYIIYNITMASLSLVVAIILVLQLTMNLNYKTNKILTIIDFIIWLIFVFDYASRYCKSTNKKKFIKRNYIDLISIIPVYSIFRVFNTLKIVRISRLARLSEISKVVRIVAILKKSNDNFSEFIKTNKFNYTIGIGISLILVGSLAMSYVEQISIGDALWWSIVTITTVGYGDISPTSPFGKIIAAILMVMGIGFIGSLSSTLSTYFIKKEHKKYHDEKLKKEIRFSKDDYKNKLIIDTIIRLEEFDELSKEELKIMCDVLKSLKIK